MLPTALENPSTTFATAATTGMGHVVLLRRRGSRGRLVPGFDAVWYGLIVLRHGRHSIRQQQPIQVSVRRRFHAGPNPSPFIPQIESRCCHSELVPPDHPGQAVVNDGVVEWGVLPRDGL